MQFSNFSLYDFQANQLIETLLTPLETLKTWLFSIVYIDWNLYNVHTIR